MSTVTWTDSTAESNFKEMDLLPAIGLNTSITPFTNPTMSIDCGTLDNLPNWLLVHFNRLSNNENTSSAVLLVISNISNTSAGTVCRSILIMIVLHNILIEAIGDRKS